MGLLDDAIREHLELKRLRGADPGEVAREEQEAFGSPYDEHEEESPAGYVEDEAQVEPSEPPPHLDDSPWLDEEEAVADLPNAGEETVEIDMQTVLDTRHQHQEEHSSFSHEPVEPVAPSHADVDPADAIGTEGDAGEDVLEETPDFLRDTPDQERLWFEQRPPRDFDFNE